MRTIALQVRKNPLVVTFDVDVDALHRTLNQDDFQIVSPGIYVRTEQVEEVGETLSVTLSIYGAGSNVARPTAICVTSLDGSGLTPYVATSIPANRSKGSATVIYHVGDSFTAGGEHEVAGLESLGSTSIAQEKPPAKKKSK